ncbi:Inositol-1 [Glugoides intestinalis]
MKTLLFNTKTRQISYQSSSGFINIPEKTIRLDISKDTTVFGFKAILGIIKVDANTRYLFFCSQSERIGAFEDSEIFTIEKVEYVPLDEKEDEETAESIKKLLEALNFYYTSGKIQCHFLWNKHMLSNFNEYINHESKSHGNSEYTESLSSFRLETEMPYKSSNRAIRANSNASKSIEDLRSPFSSRMTEKPQVKTESFETVNMICGYFESKDTRENHRLYNLKIFSKISTKKIGTRMLSRGIDEFGKVSFFVETKFVTTCESEKTEFSILRGSVPVYWSQVDPLQPNKINIDFDREKNLDAFRKHIESLEKGYGKVVVVDLLGHKKYERMLSKMYNGFCKEHHIDYINFDLNRHAENINNIKSIFYSQLTSFLTKLSIKESNKEVDESISTCGENDLNESLLARGEFFVDESIDQQENGWDDIDKESSADFYKYGYPESAELLNDLKVTFRVNCVDCLDRTNIAQYLIFNYFDKNKLSAVRSMWVNNGNALSKMYTGSHTLKNELPSKGRLSMLGRVNDLVICANRMINNKFTDKDKQTVIDLILGKKSN